MQGKIYVTLEQFVDRKSLSAIVDMLASICDEKAEHIRVNWRDTVTAKEWDKACKKLSKLSARLEI